MSEIPKNTMLRDENGNVREGVKWALELNEILVRFFGNECGYSRGFQRIEYQGKGYLGSIFELDVDKKPTKEFFDFIKDYKSDYIKGLAYKSEIIMYGKPMFRNAIIVLL